MVHSHARFIFEIAKYRHQALMEKCIWGEGRIRRENIMLFYENNITLYECYKEQKSTEVWEKS